MPLAPLAIAKRPSKTSQLVGATSESVIGTRNGEHTRWASVGEFRFAIVVASVGSERTTPVWRFWNE